MDGLKQMARMFAWVFGIMIGTVAFMIVFLWLIKFFERVLDS